MAHFALVDDNDIVVRVIVAEQDYIDTLPDKEKWIQTSFNTHEGIYCYPETVDPHPDQSKALRKNFAGVGYKYDRELDAFIIPKEENLKSWVFNAEKGRYVAPVEKPNDGKIYYWDELAIQWKERTLETPSNPT